jgi:vacuolar-type H+-ATPase subunit H
MVQTEALIKQARHEHEEEISEASESAAAEIESLQRKCNDLKLAVRVMHAPVHVNV